MGAEPGGKCCEDCQGPECGVRNDMCLKTVLFLAVCYLNQFEEREDCHAIEFLQNTF